MTPPTDLMEMVGLVAGRNDLGEGWSLHILKWNSIEFDLALINGPDCMVETCGPSLARALNALWNMVLEEEMIVPEAQLRTLHAWAAVASAQACEEKCRISTLEITEMDGTDGSEEQLSMPCEASAP
jgi:hypothetical protein